MTDVEKTDGVDIPDDESGIEMLSSWKLRRMNQRNFRLPKQEARVSPRLKVRRRKVWCWIHLARPKVTMMEAASDETSLEAEEAAKAAGRAVATQANYSSATMIRTIWWCLNVLSVAEGGTLEMKSRWDWVENERSSGYAASIGSKERHVQYLDPPTVFRSRSSHTTRTETI